MIYGVYMEKIGILGGTFNPIHNGHLKLARAALEQLSLDKILFMPSGYSYMKDCSQILPASTRIHLVELALQDQPEFQVSDMEIQRSGNTYTYETLETLKAAHPENKYYFILGADCLYTIENWRYPERIFRAGALIAAVRDQVDQSGLEDKAEELRRRMNAEIHLLKFIQVDISSSDIRNRLHHGLSIKGLVPETVEQYIYMQKLYKPEG